MLGENMRVLRKRKKLTQEEVSKILGLQRVTYTQYELNKREPDNDTLLKIASFFGVTADYLLGRDTPSLLKDEIISRDHPDPELAQLLKDNGIQKLKLAKDLTFEEFRLGIELAKTLKEQMKDNKKKS